MVDLLREKKRQYIADKTEAIKIGQQAQFWSDVSQVAGAASSITGSMATIERNREKAAQTQASSDLSAHEKEAQAIVADLRNQYGENITSEKGQQAVRDALGKHFRNYRPQYDNDRTGSAYDSGADKYINQIIDSNYLYATKEKIGRQNRERAEAERAAKQRAASANVVSQIGDLYIKQAGELGGSGANSDFHKLTTEINPTLDKVLEKVEATPEQKAAMKLSIQDAAVQNNIINALSSPDNAIAEEMDLALNNQEKFDKMFPQEYITGHIDMARNQQLREWETERARLANTAATAQGANKKTLEKDIKKIDEKIKKLTEDNQIDGENFDDKVKGDMRKALSSVTAPMARQRLGERALAARMEAFENQKQRAAKGVIDPYDPGFQMDLDALAAKESTANMTPAKKNEDGTFSAVEMSYVGGEKPKGFWKSFADDYRGYRDNMSKISPLTESSYATKMEANAGLRELMYYPTTTNEGDPVDFEKKAMEFLYKMSNSPLTEEERRNMADMVGQLLLADNEQVKEWRDLLESGDVGVYAKGGAKGVINYAANDLPLDDPRQGGGSTGARRLYDERASRGGLMPESSVGGRAYYSNTGFEKSMLRAQADYQTMAVNMMLQGATRDEVLTAKKQIFDKAISDYYRDFHVVDLAALDKKLEMHQPAFQNIDGVVYEYKGRDSIGRPLWYDHGILNTNRDFHKLFEAKRMNGAPTSGVGVTVKTSEIGSDMRAKNE